MYHGAKKNSINKPEEERQPSRRREGTDFLSPIYQPADPGLLQVARNEPDTRRLRPSLTRQLVSLQQTRGNTVVARLIVEARRLDRLADS